MNTDPPQHPRGYPLYFGVGGALLLGAGFWVAVIGLILFLMK
ncbi:hypothetical protein [Sphingomonas sp. Leaf343]|nr:hypothetical protein [Sphingomonas sp. Leaf343]